ncbi:hypothetical protein quinque_002065 [Culex quinquefasciatus]|uniref:Serine proteinase stubble n=1 Tax=Culex pipiens pipiens TaxID=38569 RepID=A0ABD1CFI3_CULPP
MWSRWKASILLVTIYWIARASSGSAATSQYNNFKITPKPCTVNGIEGTCMFVWECIKSEGQHVGVCMDSFMFGSCCSHNLTDNVIPQNYHQTVTYRPKPGGSNKYKPPKPRHLHHPLASHDGAQFHHENAAPKAEQTVEETDSIDFEQHSKHCIETKTIGQADETNYHYR